MGVERRIRMVTSMIQKSKPENTLDNGRKRRNLQAGRLMGCHRDGEN